jgi:uncharacterized metal-binding protein
MKIVLRPIPVVYACKGCEHELAAQRVVAEVDRRGLAEGAVAGSGSAKARSRYPVYVVEGCGKGCAAQWLAGHGVKPQRSFVLDPAGELAAQLENIAISFQRQ